MQLRGKKGLVVGIANEASIAFGCAHAFRRARAELAINFVNAKAEPYVRPLVERLGSGMIVPCDVREPRQIEAVFAHIRERWGTLDSLLHWIAFAPKEDLHCRITDCSQAGFAMAMDVSCHSFIRMARSAEPLMSNGGCLLTVTFYGSEKVVADYNVMGRSRRRLKPPFDTWLGSSDRSASECMRLSPGPLKTRAASGIQRFDELLERARTRTPEPQLVTIEDVGNLATFLVGNAASSLTGNIEYIDAGYHIVS